MSNLGCGSRKIEALRTMIKFRARTCRYFSFSTYAHRDALVSETNSSYIRRWMSRALSLSRSFFFRVYVSGEQKNACVFELEIPSLPTYTIEKLAYVSFDGRTRLVIYFDSFFHASDENTIREGKSWNIFENSNAQYFYVLCLSHVKKISF